jgi:hypothetical protein
MLNFPERGRTSVVSHRPIISEGLHRLQVRDQNGTYLLDGIPSSAARVAQKMSVEHDNIWQRKIVSMLTLTHLNKEGRCECGSSINLCPHTRARTSTIPLRRKRGTPNTLARSLASRETCRSWPSMTKARGCVMEAARQHRRHDHAPVPISEPHSNWAATVNSTATCSGCLKKCYGRFPDTLVCSRCAPVSNWY